MDGYRVGSITRENGAYLIELDDSELTVDMEAHLLFNAASSLAKAKAILRSGAEEIGYSGPWHWVGDARHTLWLEASHAPEGTNHDY